MLIHPLFRPTSRRAVWQSLARPTPRRARVPAVVVAGLLGAAACRPADVLNVPAPAGVADPNAFHDATGAQALRIGAIGVLANAVGTGTVLGPTAGVVQDGGFLGDEFNYTPVFLYFYHPVDSRNTGLVTSIGSGVYATDGAYIALQKARITALDAARALQGYGGSAARSQVGEMYALAGYTELFLAEGYCSGVPLSQLTPGTGVQLGVPLTTDSLFAVAALAFDTALSYASDSTQYLARVGLGRALVGRGRFAEARLAVSGVPTAFVYSTSLQPFSNAFASGQAFYTAVAAPTSSYGRFASVADDKGTNGLPYVSAHDPRMPIDSAEGPTPEGTTFYYPSKFPFGTATAIPLADGLEARLIEAEAALQVNDVTGWTTTLNALRADTADTHVAGLPMLTADSTTLASPSMQVNVMFRERAFWLFGTGRRLGDMRRLVRQYGRDQATVFPVGPYPLTGNPNLYGSSALPATYGNDVNFPIRAVESANPNFHGCLNRNA